MVFKSQKSRKQLQSEKIERQHRQERQEVRQSASLLQKKESHQSSGTAKELIKNIYHKLFL
jgi:hypothetical protein